MIGYYFLELLLGNVLYFGDRGTNGSWRIRLTALNFVFEKLIGGTWVEQNVFPITPETASSIRDKLSSLTGDNRLDSSAIKNLSVETASSIRDKLSSLTGDNRLDSSAIKNLSSWLSASIETTGDTETEILSIPIPEASENQLTFRLGCVNSDISKSFSCIYDVSFSFDGLTSLPVGVEFRKIPSDTMGVEMYVEDSCLKIKVTGILGHTFDWKIFYLPVFSFPYIA